MLRIKQVVPENQAPIDPSAVGTRAVFPVLAPFAACGCALFRGLWGRDPTCR